MSEEPLVSITQVEPELGNWQHYFDGAQLRFTQHPEGFKAGVLPVYVGDDRVVRFLVHQPKPKRNPNDVVPFGICRGSRQRADMPEDEADIRDLDSFVAIESPDHLVPAQETAISEAAQELGLEKHNISALCDAGLWHYQGTDEEYGIHLFIAQVRNPNALTPVESLKDSVAVEWKTLEELQELTKAKQFKPGYMDIVTEIQQGLPHALGTALSQSSEPNGWQR